MGNFCIKDFFDVSYVQEKDLRGCGDSDIIISDTYRQTVSERQFFTANPICWRGVLAYFAVVENVGGDRMKQTTEFRIGIGLALLPSILALACSAMSLYLGEVAR